MAQSRFPNVGGNPHDFVRSRLDRLKELPAPETTWTDADLNDAAADIFETLRRNIRYDIIETVDRTTQPDGTQVARYRTAPEYWALIQELREDRAEFPCGDSAGVHHVANPDGEKRFTCGNEFCDARYTRAEVREAMQG